MEEQEGRIVAMEEQPSDDWQYSLRPRKLNEYIGQEEAKENLSVFIRAALKRGEALDHVLPVLVLPPGQVLPVSDNILCAKPAVFRQRNKRQVHVAFIL